jgi:hypothetical protein
MKIKYTGRRKIRIVGPYQWDESNDFIQEVTDPELAEDLLSEPSNEWMELPAEYEPPKKKKKWN